MGRHPLFSLAPEALHAALGLGIVVGAVLLADPAIFFSFSPIFIWAPGRAVTSTVFVSNPSSRNSTA